jgi:hypothetical protein
MRKHTKTALALLFVGTILALWTPRPAPGQESRADERAPAFRGKLRGASPFLDSRLVQLAELERSQGAAAAEGFAATNAVPLDRDRRARVLVHTRGLLSAQAVQALEARIEMFRGEVLGRADGLIEARIPIEAVEGLAGPGEIRWIEPSPIPVPMAVTSQGVAVTQANRLLESSAAYRPSAEPIRVGVLDGGFEGYQQLLGGELPASVTARSFSAQGIGAGSSHGTACAEIVHDMAPEAQLYLANFDGITSHGAAVDWLIGQGVDVISYSIGWFNMGPGDGRGPVNDHVRRATSAGIQWVGAAGNEGDMHWEGTFSDPDGDGWHNYTATDLGNSISLRAGDTLIVWLNWDDWFLSNQDYDLYIADSATNRIVAASENFQAGSQPPTEAIGIRTLVDRTYFVAIHRYDASRNVKLEAFFEVEGAGSMQYVVPAGSLTIPADTDDAIAVGATYWGSDVAEPFSSRGPTTDGRVKPDLTAPDGVDTASYLAQGRSFYGTSASTPHVAGAIAALKSRFGMFTLDQVVEILYGRAIDRGPAGKDTQYGEGRLDLVGR